MSRILEATVLSLKKTASLKHEKSRSKFLQLAWLGILVGSRKRAVGIRQRRHFLA